MTITDEMIADNLKSAREMMAQRLLCKEQFFVYNPYYDNDIIQCCTMGAMLLATYKTEEYDRDTHYPASFRSDTLEGETLRSFVETLSEYLEGEDEEYWQTFDTPKRLVEAFNDDTRTTKRNVLAMFDIAIQNAEAKLV